MKKQLLTLATLSVFGSASMFAQHNFVKSNSVLSTQATSQHSQHKLRCGTEAPSAEWDAEFNKMVESYKAQHTDQTGKVSAANYTIPVIVHIIHSGEAVGTASNISQAQVIDQIRILNEDYAGIGLSSNNVPYAFNQLKADCNVQFCLATHDEGGNLLAEPGIDRVAASSIPVTVPGTGLTSTTINNTIKPATIWDPTKYCNMWVLKIDQNLLGYATFPAGSTLSGMSSLGTNTTDGLVMGYNYFGSIGAAASSAPYNKGRTTTHEIGHWLGLRHIWGDNGQCGATDYCVDTPPQQGETNAPAGCYYGTPTGGYNGFPKQPSTCTRPDGVASANITNTNGDMFMNFMDYTDDAAMYMFTTDQRTRIQTAMANGTHRKFLGTHGLCSSLGIPAAAPVAGFDWERTTVASAAVCNGVAVNFRDASRNYPTSWTWSTNPTTGVTITSASSQNPTINFTNGGTYTVTLVASNVTGPNTKTRTIVVNSCATSAPTAAFTIASTGCTGVAVSTANTSSGNPTPTYVWSSNPSAGVTFSSTTATAPTVTFTNPGTYTVGLAATNSQGTNNTTQVITVTSCAVTACDTLMNMSDTSTITIYGAATGGYLTGNNGYNFTNLAEYYNQVGLSGNRVTGMITTFYRSGTEGTGGTGNVAFQVYAATGAANAPNTILKTDNVSLPTILSNGVTTGPIITYTHMFSTSYTLTTNNFHVGILLPTNQAGGDTAAVISGLIDVNPQVNTAYAKFGGSWVALGPALSSTNLALAMYPIICPPSVGLSSSELNTKVSVFPNPTTGILNIAYNFNTKEDLKIEVTNMLGQVVYTELENNTTTNAKTINLSGLSKGVYMVTLSTATDKMVRKIVIE